jgi:hypothetical protein
LYLLEEKLRAEEEKLKLEEEALWEKELEQKESLEEGQKRGKKIQGDFKNMLILHYSTGEQRHEEQKRKRRED